MSLINLCWDLHPRKRRFLLKVSNHLSGSMWNFGGCIEKDIGRLCVRIKDGHILKNMISLRAGEGSAAKNISASVWNTARHKQRHSSTCGTGVPNTLQESKIAGKGPFQACVSYSIFREISWIFIILGGCKFPSLCPSVCMIELVYQMGSFVIDRREWLPQPAMIHSKIVVDKRMRKVFIDSHSEQFHPDNQPVELPSCYKALWYFDIRYRVDWGKTSKDLYTIWKGFSNLTTIWAAKNTSRIRSLGLQPRTFGFLVCFFHFFSHEKSILIKGFWHLQGLFHVRLESFMRWRNHAGGDPWPPLCCGRPQLFVLHHGVSNDRGRLCRYLCVSLGWFVSCSFDPATVGFLHRHGLRIHCAGLWILIVVGARIPVARVGKDMLQGW